MSSKFEAIYNSKKITVSDALSTLRPGDEAGIANCAMEPLSILDELHTLKGKIHDLHLVCCVGIADHPFWHDAEMQKCLMVHSFFFGAYTRESHRLGFASYVPCNLHNGTARRFNHRTPNVFIGTASPMDKHGFVRSSLSVALDKDFWEAADRIIMEINPYMPIVEGETQIHISDIDYIVEVDRPVPKLPSPVLSKEDETIGRYVAELVADGDTIQLGIGTIPDSVAKAFVDKHDLGVHTEMLTSSIADLVEQGVVTNKKKTLHNGKMVATFAFGSQKLYDMMDCNPSVMLMRTSYANDPWVIAQNDNMVSINTALQVDLTGQVCSESLGTLQYSGTGGQSDTAQGAIRAKNGRSIIALRSTAKNGTISTIQPFLQPGSVVSLQRNNVDYIVTEYGIAPLRGRNIRERVNNLTAIAHPDFRSELLKDAEKYWLR
jgi:acyl-CoA hydrolase